MDAQEIARRAEEARQIVLDCTQADLSAGEVSDKYSKWSANYDEDVAILNYHGPKLMAEEVAAILGDRKDARIIDVGSGTGLVGKHLVEMGFCNLDAVDGSPGMLEKANKKQVYQNVTCAKLGNTTTSLTGNAYDVAVCCGAVAGAHLDHTCLAEIIRVTKLGGLVIFLLEQTLNQYGDFEENFESAILKLEQDKKWIKKTRRILPNYYDGDGGLFLVFEVLKHD